MSSSEMLLDLRDKNLSLTFSFAKFGYKLDSPFQSKYKLVI